MHTITNNNYLNIGILGSLFFSSMFFNILDSDVSPTVGSPSVRKIIIASGSLNLLSSSSADRLTIPSSFPAFATSIATLRASCMFVPTIVFQL